MKRSSWLIFSGAFLLDLLSKYLVLQGVVPLEAAKNSGLPFVGKVFPGFFDLALVLSALLLFAVLYRKFFSRDSDKAFALILGGAAANIVDRAATGGVTDFLDIGLGGKFNLADVAIWLGILFLGYNVIKNKSGTRNTSQ